MNGFDRPNRQALGIRHLSGSAEYTTEWIENIHTLKRITIDEYEKETGSYEEVQYLSYYLTTLSAFLTQAIMWIALILCCSPEGFDNILHSITFHQIASHYSSNIELTHLVLAAFMIIFILITYIFSKKEKKVNYS